MAKSGAGIEDRASFDIVIDARSPAEYALDHIPGAINCPVLDDEERRIVGTLYVQVSPFEARKVGGAMVARNIARHLESAVFKDQPRSWKPLVYCWRGGQRSGSFTDWLRLVGWDAQQLQGGYKRWRAHVIAQIAERMPRLELRVLTGATGSAKTRVLHALAALGEQVIDLEALAGHRGSVLGSVPGVEQPSQKRFETLLCEVLDNIDPARPVFVEAESRRIGRIAVPDPVLLPLRAARCVEIEATPAARLAYLLRDYAFLGDDRAALQAKLAQLHGLQSNETLARWQQWAAEGALEPLFAELMERHYDPLYERSQGRNYLGLDKAPAFATDDLSETGIEELARRIADAD
ncbi:tRNA 2-selenouridine(34) synthase MnmH [Rivibacter subsaxonicus]|uniref:tRNA 2-selenouridine synthase n=1 Tax=Rivibacter subsaxonicus TaxID=457575 RepID=A0A4Q7W137_9BURK|nr:tRNA 2-selenouridine(34) synthase MnmH [Rivibacter subsaxonicus]RZU02921.1 tRNA 2-selenouridine synthase [Rivibacter subsaxonicus]